MKNKTKTVGIFIKFNEQEEEIIKTLRNKYAINISKFVRNSLISLHEKLDKLDEKQEA